MHFSRALQKYIIQKKYFFNKNPLNYYSLKVTTFHVDSVKNDNARTKQTIGPTHAPPPAFLGLNLRRGSNIVGST